MHGPPVGRWEYHYARGEVVGIVLRWNRPGGGKDIRPVSRFPDGWRIAGMPPPRPLYGLPGLAGARRVYIVEGEKAADAARSLGLIATTSAHGAKSASGTDWGPLAGLEVIFLPDNDDPGRQYVDVVAAILGGLEPPPTVKVVELPDLPDGGDIVDWLEARAGADPAEMRREIETMVDGAEAIDLPAPQVDAPLRYQRFPVEALPEPVRGFVRGAAKAIGCDPVYVALPLLVGMASAIGTTRRLRLKHDWLVPSIIWGAIIGESGTSKTPAFSAAMQFVDLRQQLQMERYAIAMRDYQVERTRYEKEYSLWKRDKHSTADPPEEPQEPQPERSAVSDTTVEALAPLILANPRGLLLKLDELSGWFGSFDRYAGGKGGGDSANWLSMYNAQSLIVDRKTGTPRTIYVPQAAVSVCGGIQPAILHRSLGREHRESGLAARMLLACPPRMPKRWSEARIDPADHSRMAQVFDRLYGLQPGVDDEGQSCPVVVMLSVDAKKSFEEFYNANGREQATLTGDLAAAWSKLEEYPARLALVIHLARWAADDPTLENPEQVDAASMAAGIQLVGWFKGETRRIYAMLEESDEDREDRELIEWIERRGGRASARELQQGNRRYPKAEMAESALNELAKAGRGQWVDSPKGAQGGRPSRVFVLSDAPPANETPEIPAESEGSVDVDGREDRQTPPDSDWGEVA